MSLGEKLCALRKQAGLTQGELGAKLNLSAQAISKWEKNASEPDISTLRRLAEIYGTSVAEIIGDTPTGESGEDTDAQGESADAPARYSLYIIEVNSDRKLHAIKLIRELLGLGLAEAKRMAEEFPSYITGQLTETECDELAARLTQEGITTEKRESAPTDERVELYPGPKKQELPAELDGIMKKYFFWANISAMLPALFLMICGFFDIAVWTDVLFAIYVGIMTYALIFQLWYPTFIRSAFYVMWHKIIHLDGIFSFIGSIILLPVKLFVSIIFWIISPVFYAFTIRKRIRRMKDNNILDNVL